MSKCVKCGNEILTGDIHWEMGLCNNCYNKLYKDHKSHISLDKMWLEITQSFRYENDKLQDKIADLEAKLAEKDKLLNQYPYKNDVIEKQYEDLKYAITFLMLNNIKDQEQLNHAIDVLCEKHKARIRDIENGICKIEQLEQQLAEKDKEIENLKASSDKNIEYLKEFVTLIKDTKDCNMVLRALDRVKKGQKYIIDKEHQDKISFAVEQLNLLYKTLTTEDVWRAMKKGWWLNNGECLQLRQTIDNQIKAIKGEK